MRTEYNLNVLLACIDDERKEHLTLSYNDEEIKGTDVADMKPDWLDLHIIEKNADGDELLLVLGE